LSVVLLVLCAGALAAGDTASPEVARARGLLGEGEFESAIDVLREAVAKSPFDFPLRLELARASVGLARRVAAGDDAGMAALAWLDAVSFLEDALRLRPFDDEGLRLLAEAAEGAGQPGKAADAWLKVLLALPGDASIRRRAGHALLAAGRAQEAVEAFRTAEAIEGPEAEALLARARAHDALRQSAEAMEIAARLYRLEAARGVPDSPCARGSLALLWSVARSSGRLDRLEIILAGWCERYADLTAPPYYLGCARQALGRSVPAAEAFRTLTERAPDWATGWRLLADGLLGAGKPAEAADALGKAHALAPDEGEDARLLAGIARAAAGAGDPSGALAFLDRLPAVEGGDRDLRRLRGELLLRAGRAEEAARRFSALLADDPADVGLGTRLQKAVARLLSAGAAPADLAVLRRSPAEGAGAPAMIADFEDSEVLVRLSRGAEGRREGGTFRFARRPDRGALPARLSVQFLPEIDARPYAAVRFDVRGSEGIVLRVGAKDRWDDYDLDLPMMNRFFHREAVRLSGERKTVVLPLDGFLAPGDAGTVPGLAREALRAVTFEIEPGEIYRADEVEVDNVALVTAAEVAEDLVDFEADPAESIVSFEGAAAPLQSVPRIGQTVEDYPADATTFVNPLLLGSEFEPSMAWSGQGSVRVACSTRNEPEDDRPAAMRLTFLPPRDCSGARALVFRARGEKGGERLALTIADGADEELGSDGSDAPRTLSGGRLVAGVFTLEREWKSFRVPLSDYPELDLRNVRTLRFVIGGDRNEKSARVYLDDIGLE
jgi:tetratricopeptide (TPR) repeat protein